ncbi:unnamed protein product [Ixodes hexagonus]
MCCVPQCTNRAVEGTISLHSFPLDKRLKKAWLIKLRMGKPVTATMRVCSCHFAERDFFWNTTGLWSPTLKRLKRGTVPSLCLPVRQHDRPAPKPRRQRGCRTRDRASGGYFQRKTRSSCVCAESKMRFEVPISHILQVTAGTSLEDAAAEDTTIPHRHDDELIVARALLSLQSGGPPNTQARDRSVQVDTKSLVPEKKTLVSFLTTDAAVKAFTGVESMQLLERISRNVERFDTMRTDASVHERVVLVLVRLKTFLSFKCVSTLFCVSEATVHIYFYGTLPSLAAVLKSAVYWPTREENKNNLPRCFKDYAEVRVVLDCTEVEIEKSHCGVQTFYLLLLQRTPHC